MGKKRVEKELGALKKRKKELEDRWDELQKKELQNEISEINQRIQQKEEEHRKYGRHPIRRLLKLWQGAVYLLMIAGAVVTVVSLYYPL